MKESIGDNVIPYSLSLELGLYEYQFAVAGVAARTGINKSGTRSLLRSPSWRLQVLEEGDLSERARARATDIARGFFGAEKSVRLTVPAAHGREARSPEH